MASKKQNDPTITSESVDATAYPEGTHPARSPEEVTHSASRITYKDNPDKPDPSSIAQIAIVPDDFPGQS